MGKEKNDSKKNIEKKADDSSKFSIVKKLNLQNEALEKILKGVKEKQKVKKA